MLKNKYFSIPFIMLLACCKAKNNIDTSEQDYLMAYKKTVFYECVNSATKGNLYKFSEENKDLGVAPEVAIIYHSDVAHAKQIGIELASKIRTINYSDYDGKKPIFSDCIELAFSEYVDSIAKLNYKKLKKSKIEYKSE